MMEGLLLPSFVHTYTYLEPALPFLLLFTVFYATLEKIKFADAKGANTGIALALAFIAIVPHYVYGYDGAWDPVRMIYLVFPYLSLLIVGIICAGLLAGIFGLRISFMRFLFLLIVIDLLTPDIVVYSLIFGRAVPGGLDMLVDFWERLVDIGLLSMLVFLVVIWYITYEPGKSAIWQDIKDIAKGK